MEKILLVMCGGIPTKSALDFACYLSDMTRSRLTGFFYETAIYEMEPELEVTGSSNGKQISYHPIELKSYISGFEQTCENRGIPVSVRYLEGNIGESIIAESRFADLIIADAAVSVNSKTQESPSPLLQHLLANAQCPIMIAPSSFTPIQEVVYCYDGSPSAVFAMKQLTYLLPELGEAKASVVQINDEDIPGEEKKHMLNWLSRHFETSDIVTLKGKSEQALFDFLLKKQHALVVMGAYGRNMVSRLFRHSHADLLIRTLAYPLFITHY
ncbi:universal stress protein [Chitinophaga polysaccharea]|uniref:universal stress protein n=1 Tax=Chitinophaga TaxID=79328 RepID=UPI0014557BF1|nr:MULTISPECIES: universal stress protein [Chitinophaga]NLR60349.1 universal stress protein [Chitinophaga polysaccharea]NLU95990.1 universal stress protein [Chitinophaga sp. Ak27]